MLKTTYKKSAPLEQPANQTLPPGWTQHQAPTGHAYYYNTQTKQSTYARPTVPTTELVSSEDDGKDAATVGFSNPSPAQSFSLAVPGAGFRGGRSYQDRSRKKDNDRPRTKHDIPNCNPWVLVKTKFGRRFVYNRDSHESFWRFPEHVILAVAEMDRVEQEGRARNDSSRPSEKRTDSAEPNHSHLGTRAQSPVASVAPEVQENDSDSYEEVEVTDEEEEEEGEGEMHAKRQKTLEIDEAKPFEFDEDDIAYQLAEMGEDYGLDPEEYAAYEVGRDDDNAETVGALPLSDSDATALFYDLLDDHRLSPYTTWESVIENSQIIEDSRYTVLPNMRSRREAFTEWSRLRIHALREQRAKEEKSDPRIQYVRFLDEYATPKLYWPEFRRKYKNSPEMKDSKLLDKARERMYRDHIARLKLPEATRQSDLLKLLKEKPLSELNRNTAVEALPPSVLVDTRFISLPTKTRDTFIKSHISTLSNPTEGNNGILAESQSGHERKAVDRQKREEALAERERMVAENKRKQSRALRHGMDLMKENEMEIDEAMRARKDGLLNYFDDSNHNDT
ncbi:MAG: hypothetical protein Q9160_005676 [Pyrenula sp. 1 TL-2023]